MTKPTRETLFKPTLSRTESKAEAVSRIAMSMIEQETARREAKTERLRQARLDRDAAEAATPSSGKEPASVVAKPSKSRAKVAGKAATKVPAGSAARSAG